MKIKFHLLLNELFVVWICFGPHITLMKHECNVSNAVSEPSLRTTVLTTPWVCSFGCLGRKMRNELGDRTDAVKWAIRSFLVFCFVATVIAAPALPRSTDVNGTAGNRTVTEGFLQSSNMIAFSNDLTGGSGFPFTFLDAVGSTVPEPAGLILLGTGILGIVGAWRRKRITSPTMTKTTIRRE
jgi:hypothetical protein